MLVLALAAPRLADQHDTETLGAWAGERGEAGGDLGKDGFRATDPLVLDPLAQRIAASARPERGGARAAG
ncbi:MAG TPA: hypothetical protein VGR87_00070 [Candidatus Limnocylindria bacterium]|nr:hypothetical protein [Candidatus Limnocylindria bacterium]